MIKVSKLITELQKLPPNAYAYAYEGEVTGIVVVSSLKEQRKELCVILANERVQEAE